MEVTADGWVVNHRWVNGPEWLLGLSGVDNEDERNKIVICGSVRWGCWSLEMVLVCTGWPQEVIWFLEIFRWAVSQEMTNLDQRWLLCSGEDILKNCSILDLTKKKFKNFKTWLLCENLDYKNISLPKIFSSIS
jgi:hypothetical protein